MASHTPFEKVLFIGMNYHTSKGGMASVLQSYARMISPFKFVSTVATDIHGIQKLFYALRGILLTLWKLLTDRHIQYVHVHACSAYSFWRKGIIMLLAHMLGKKVIFHCHGGGFKEFRLTAPKRVDWFLSLADYTVCLSSQWKTYFESIGCKNVTIIHNIIDEPQILSFPKDNRIHLLFLGLICDPKGIFDLLQTLALHKEELEGKVLLHVGGNGQTERLKSTIKQLKIQDLVHFEGWVDKDKKIQLLNQTDVFILPSYVEGVPISLLEAASYSIPVITCPVGGIPSIVKDQETGLFFTPGNTEELYQAIHTLVNNPTLRKQMGQGGKTISQHYLPNIVLKELIQLYQ